VRRSRASASRDVDIVIADLALEGQESGVDLLHWLREHRPDVRRVLTSGSTRPQVTIDSPEQAFLSKPFGRLELAEILGA
jgi:DNA-binding NarL/FixJ family response regulator